MDSGSSFSNIQQFPFSVNAQNVPLWSAAQALRHLSGACEQFSLPTPMTRSAMDVPPFSFHARKQKREPGIMGELAVIDIPRALRLFPAPPRNIRGAQHHERAGVTRST
jgi:hypothetical protein